MERWEEVVVALERKAKQHRAKCEELQAQIKQLQANINAEDRRAKVAGDAAEYVRRTMNDTPGDEVPW